MQKKTARTVGKHRLVPVRGTGNVLRLSITLWNPGMHQGPTGFVIGPVGQPSILSAAEISGLTQRYPVL